MIKNNKIRNVKKVPIMKALLGFTLIFLGLFGAVTTNIFSLVLAGMGIFLAMSEGSEIDLETKTYKEFYTIFGIDLGTWKNLPTLEYVSIFRTKENSRVQGMGASANFSNPIFLLNVFYDRNKKIEAYKTEEIDDAFKMAKIIANALQIDILDATERESKWI
ncbi:hypothetical protein [Bizionia arctica]|uniref:Uncharacterized protein n=1 Tax=Bizionia arctica TaxID=1495645 RepID=A0A917LL06_9FLAO|nr:hypothetical protein [Bizionia arctica]GGG38128.1 hypothetical protein GCM10010976_07320 [Bizionia arctica]